MSDANHEIVFQSEVTRLQEQIDSTPLAEINQQLIEQKNSEIDDLHAEMEQLKSASETTVLVGAFELEHV